MRGVEAEAGDHEPAGLHVGGDPLHGREEGARREEWDDVAREDHEVEGLRAELEAAQVLLHPHRRGVPLLGDGDHVGIRVDPDAVVAERGELRGHPARAAARVEDAGRGRHE